MRNKSDRTWLKLGLESAGEGGSVRQSGNRSPSLNTDSSCFPTHGTPRNTKRGSELAARLRADGIDLTLDQWHAIPGDQLTQLLKRIARISCAGDASWAADIWREADRRWSLLVCVHCLGWLIEDHESIAPMVSLSVCITY